MAGIEYCYGKYTRIANPQKDAYGTYQSYVDMMDPIFYYGRNVYTDGKVMPWCRPQPDKIELQFAQKNMVLDFAVEWDAKTQKWYKTQGSRTVVDYYQTQDM